MFQFQKTLSNYRALVLLITLFTAVALPAYSQKAGAIPQKMSERIAATAAQGYPLPTYLQRPADAPWAAIFAWEQFLALNRKADLTPGHRGAPDSSLQLGESCGFQSAESCHPLIWQTYAHKVELRPNGPLTTPWSRLGTPNYKNQAYQKSIRQGTDDHQRAARWNLWNNLDEDNEIGSCNVNSPYQSQNPNDPRELILYQVKVNKDEYEYLRVSYGAHQHEKGGKLGKAQRQVAKYIKWADNPNHAYYQGAPTGASATCDCPPDLAICLPCGGHGSTIEGAIETKSAWRRLHPKEDASRFYTAPAVYYEYDEVSQSYKYNNGTFALIGLHIIRKLVNYPDFVFTTFEHNDLENSNYEYYTIDDGVQNGPLTRAVRQTGESNRQQNHRVLPAVETYNRHYQQNVVPSTVWANYRLTGIQTQSIDCQPASVPSPNPSKTAKKRCIDAQNPVQCLAVDPNQNYFMANLVIESDPFLNNFSGPGFGGNPFGNCQNTVYNSKTYNNGGCKGCHGVAQTSFGTDFSFLLDFGQGKPAVEPDTIHFRPKP
jgi:hypothetical protein